MTWIPTRMRDIEQLYRNAYTTKRLCLWNDMQAPIFRRRGSLCRPLWQLLRKTSHVKQKQGMVDVPATPVLVHIQ